MPGKSPESAFSPEIAERRRAGIEAAHRNVTTARSEHAGAFESVEKSIQDLRRPGQPKKARLFRLQQLGAKWSGLYARHGACRAGCAHCCHLETLVYRSEAEVVAKATGRPLREPRRPKLSLLSEPVAKAGYDNPCVFLHESRCSIYEARPLVCRTTVNMDDSAELCALLVSDDVPAPFANWASPRTMLDYLCEGETLADIRDWFRPEE